MITSLYAYEPCHEMMMIDDEMSWWRRAKFKVSKIENGKWESCLFLKAVFSKTPPHKSAQQ